MKPFLVSVALGLFCLSIPFPSLSEATEAEFRCATSATPLPLRQKRHHVDFSARTRGGGPRAAGFNVNIVAGPTLAGNAAALAAFERAADQWEAVFSDPITVNINADLANLGDEGIIGQASSVALVDTHDIVADAMRADALDEADDGIVASLPTSGVANWLLPAGFSVSGNIVANKSVFKALGFADLDTDFGSNDATITFNSQFTFDYDNSDGVDPGSVDFETVAAHEIGHALGFTSAVDNVDFFLDNGATSSNISPEILDLFRFRPQGSSDPSNAGEFATFARSVEPNQASNFDQTTIEYGFSTGRFTGDGRQASHWKADELTGTNIGIMDPTLSNGVATPVKPADVLALDLIGWEAAAQTTTTLVTTTTTSTTTTLPASLCGGAPVGACRETAAGKAQLQVKNKGIAAKNQLKWKWSKGAATTLGDFGDPVEGEPQYTLCVYDSSVDPQPLMELRVLPQGSCNGKPCWKATGTSGFKYKDKTGFPDGATSLKFKAGVDGKASLQVQAKSENFLISAPPYTTPLTVQLLADNGTSVECFESVLSLAQKNDSSQFKAKGP